MSAPQIFVLIDALGWELVAERPFLAEYLPNQQPLRSLLGFSSGIIPSILTGLTPAQHGMWNLVYYAPEKSPFRWMKHIGVRPARMLDNRIGRRLLTELGRRLLGMGDNFDISVPVETLPWFDWAESRNIYQRGGVPGQQSIFDLLHEKGIPHRIYSYKDDVSDADILANAERHVLSGAEEFYFIYLCELDMFLHLHRKEPELIRQKLKWYEERLGKVFRAAKKRSSEAGLHVFSDHGMAPVIRHCDLAADVARSGFEAPRDYLVVYDSTMARFWYFREGAKEKLRAIFAKLDYARLLPEAELRDFGVYFEDHRYGEDVLLLDAGCIIAESGFNGAGWKPSGMHGYHPDDVYSNAVYLSSEAPRRPMQGVCDVFGRMAEELG